jgi:hypothetical protein
MNANKKPVFRTFSEAFRIRILRSPFMFVRYSIWLTCTCVIPMLISCGEKQQEPVTNFTKTDSLTDTYLALQDSVLQSWNMMINDDNRKLEAMDGLLHELVVSRAADLIVLDNYKERLQQLKRSRYTQKTMSNAHIVEEYDFASNALISELISLAESQKEFAYNPTLQKLADQIRTADQRVETYREQYDNITVRYNAFLENNREYLKDIDMDSSLEKKPVFHLAEEEVE